VSAWAMIDTRKPRVMGFLLSADVNPVRPR